LVENIDELTSIALQREIAQVIANYEPRASVSKVYVFADYENNGFSVEVEFSVINQSDPITITFFLERIR
jgi:predicted component of type VI protein secretion system